MMKLSIKRWVLSSHAVARMRERSISLHQVETTIKDFDNVLIQGPKYLLCKDIEGRTDNAIAVVITEKKAHDLWVVITVMTNFQKS